MGDALKALASQQKKRLKDANKEIKSSISAQEKEMKERQKSDPSLSKAEKKAQLQGLDKRKKTMGLEKEHEQAIELLAKDQEIVEEHLLTSHAARFDYLKAHLKRLLDTND